MIKEGYVASVHCPDPACVGARAKWTRVEGQLSVRPGEVSASELRDLVGDDASARFQWFEREAVGGKRSDHVSLSSSHLPSTGGHGDERGLSKIATMHSMRMSTLSFLKRRSNMTF